MQHQRWLSFVLIFSLLILVFPVPSQAQCLDLDQDRMCDDVDPCPNDRNNRCDDDSDGDSTLLLIASYMGLALIKVARETLLSPNYW
jgi:hypothetical protein